MPALDHMIARELLSIASEITAILTSTWIPYICAELGRDRCLSVVCGKAAFIQMSCLLIGRPGRGFIASLLAPVGCLCGVGLEGSKSAPKIVIRDPLENPCGARVPAT